MPYRWVRFPYWSRRNPTQRSGSLRNKESNAGEKASISEAGLSERAMVGILERQEGRSDLELENFPCGAHSEGDIGSSPVLISIMKKALFLSSVILICGCNISVSNCSGLISARTSAIDQYNTALRNGYAVDRDAHLKNVASLDSMIVKVCNCKGNK